MMSPSSNVGIKLFPKLTKAKMLVINTKKAIDDADLGELITLNSDFCTVFVMI